MISILLSDNETAATLYGKEHEQAALEQLASVCGITITQPRKVVPRLNKWLVCIPDGLVEAGEGEEAAIVEVKCPYKCAEARLETVAEKDEHFCLELLDHGRLQLRRDHDYYYQVCSHWTLDTEC